MSEENKKEPLTEEQAKNIRILELIILVILGFFILLPLILYGYHFLI
ncbi:MAG: hypothetical protein ACTSYC_03735 [Promethearchaeota archaeon]